MPRHYKRQASQREQNFRIGPDQPTGFGVDFRFSLPGRGSPGRISKPQPYASVNPQFIQDAVGDIGSFFAGSKMKDRKKIQDLMNQSGGFSTVLQERFLPGGGKPGFFGSGGSSLGNMFDRKRKRNIFANIGRSVFEQ